MADRKVILITGASSGFGNLTARALARAGHTVYAGMRAGQRPFRTHVDPSRDGSEVVSAVSDRIRAEFYHRIGIADLLPARASL